MSVRETPELAIEICDDGIPDETIAACCDDPTPEVMTRERDGDKLSHLIYCASCDTDLVRFSWSEEEVTKHFQASHDPA
jgi:hypothetical protein